MHTNENCGGSVVHYVKQPMNTTEECRAAQLAMVHNIAYARRTQDATPEQKISIPAMLYTYM